MIQKVTTHMMMNCMTPILKCRREFLFDQEGWVVGNVLVLEDRNGKIWNVNLPDETVVTLDDGIDDDDDDDDGIVTVEAYHGGLEN